MIHETPKPTTKVVWGPKYLFAKLPKFARNLGAGLTAMGAAGLAMEWGMDKPPAFAEWMAWSGAAGAFLTAMFGKK